ncbi:acyl-CoA dehydrogenase family protein [Neobacillus muris]|uniref:acyl-CoA dehydrogenase family protein n=1 Tax=Neobacillus muris TaxID=2941334 RepID=UPI00203DD9F6|nr:acyl-CoA dehydrogenase family protein [Neobacillus muris]
MISFMPNEDEISFVDVAKSFAIEHLRPRSRLIEETGEVPDDMAGKLQELGFTTLELLESFDGLELPLVSQVQVLEALSFGDLAAVQGLPGFNETASFIRANPENPLFVSLKDKRPTGSLLVNPFHHSLTIQTNRNGYRLNGVSIPVKMGEVSTLLIIAGVDENREDVLLLLEKETHQWKSVIGDRRLGLLASKCARLQFDQLEVPEDCVLARGEAARQVTRDALARIRILEAAKEVGTMAAALAYATEYTAGRKAFGQEIAKFQGVSFTAAQMAIQTQGARNLVWHAAKKLDDQEPDAIQASLSALHFAHRAVRFVTDSAVQLLGGHGYVQDHPVEKWMRDAQAQVNLWESETELLVKSGEYLLLGKEGNG